MLESVLPVGTRWALRSFPTQPALGFRDFMIQAEFQGYCAHLAPCVTTERLCHPEPWGVRAAEGPQGTAGLPGLQGAGGSRVVWGESHPIAPPCAGAVLGLSPPVLTAGTSA